MASAPVDAASGVAGDIRDRLPGSDAETGPLSDLTDAGEAIMTTPAEAAEKSSDALAAPLTQIPGFGGGGSSSSSGSGSPSAGAIRDALNGMSLQLGGTLDVDGDVATLDDIDAELRRVKRQADNRTGSRN